MLDIIALQRADGAMRSLARPVIFLHIPKCAGTSLRVAIENSAARERLIPMYADKIGIPVDEARKSIDRDSIIFGHVRFGLHERLGAQPNYATVLRHPIDRIISLYKHLYREERLDLGRSFRSGMSIHDVLDNKISPEFFNDMTCIVSGMESAREGDKNAFEKAKENIDKYFCFICIKAQIEMNVPALREIFAAPELVFGRCNVGTGPQIEVDRTLAEAIAKANALDMKLFDYARRKGEGAAC